MKINTVLQSLNLQDNKIGTQGLISLFKALQTNKTLKDINLMRNPMDKEALKAFMLALKGLSTSS